MKIIQHSKSDIEISISYDFDQIYVLEIGK
jgi:hypothetical protein